jgi:hypothetical protein
MAMTIQEREALINLCTSISIMVGVLEKRIAGLEAEDVVTLHAVDGLAERAARLMHSTRLAQTGPVPVVGDEPVRRSDY